LACDQDVEISVAVHVDCARVVGALVLVECSLAEVALSIIQVEGYDTVGFFATSDGIDVAL